MNNRKTKAQEKALRIYNELINDRDLLTKRLEDVAMHFNMPLNTLRNYRYKYDFFKVLLDDRLKIMDSRPKEEKKYLTKGSSQNLYAQYLTILETYTQEDFKMKNTGIIYENRKLLKVMGLYDCSCSASHKFKIEVVDEFEFLKRLAKVKGVPLIYIFDTDNELISLALSYKDAGRRTGNTEITVKRRINDPSLYAIDYYYSYNKDFKIIAVKPINNNYLKGQLANVKKGIKEAQRVNDLLTKNKSWHALGYKDLSKKIGVDTSTLFKYFKKYEFMNHWQSVFRDAKKELAEQNKIKKEKEKQEKQKEERLKRQQLKQITKVLDARNLAKSKEVTLSPQEVLRIAKIKEKQGLLKSRVATKLGEKGLRDKLAYLRKDNKISKQLNEY